MKPAHEMDSPASARHGRYLWTAVTAIAAAQIAWHAPTHFQTFVLDDFTWLACADRSRHSLGNIFTLEVSGFRRPVVHLVFLANYAACGLSAWGYYAVNLLLEAACTVAFAALALRLTGSARATVCAAVLFAGHHAHGEVVSWISARTSSLLALWTLITILAWLRWRASKRARWWVVAFAAHLLALLTKEEAVALLPILLVMDRLQLPVGVARSGQPRSWKSTVASLAPFAVVLVAYLAMQLSVQSQNALVAGGDYVFGIPAIPRLLERLSGLFVVKRAAASPWRELTVGVMMAVGWFVLRRAPTALRRTAAFGLLIALLALLPTAGFTSHDASRYYYVASIGASLAWAAVIVGVVSSQPPRPALSPAILLLAAATLLTHAYDQRRRTESFRKRSDANHAIIASAVAMQPVWQTARESNTRVCIVNPPLGEIEMRALLWLAGRLDASRIDFAIGSPAGAACKADGTLRITWDDESRSFSPD